MSKALINVENLKKSYGAVEAVKGISFKVQEGELFAFLGTNGAGKSTTIEILCTLLKKSSGLVEINNFTLDEKNNNDNIRQSIGVVFQQSLLDKRLTVYENIMYRGGTYGLSKKELNSNYHFVSTYLQLEDIQHKKYGTLSGGQKRRADIARALIHKPRILFLDEPTTGLDPQTRQFVWEAVKKLQQETNMTVFLTTHYMEEAAVANQVVVLKSGEIVAKGTPDELKTMYAYDQLKLVFKNEVEGENLLKDMEKSFTKEMSIYSVKVDTTLEALTFLKSAEPLLVSFEVIKGTMDDVFLRIIENGGKIS